MKTHKGTRSIAKREGVTFASHSVKIKSARHKKRVKGYNCGGMVGGMRNKKTMRPGSRMVT